jgi:hypothetical protein
LHLNFIYYTLIAREKDMGLTYQKYDHINLTVFRSTEPITVDEWIDTLRDYNNSGATRSELYDLRKHGKIKHPNNIRALHHGTSPGISIQNKDCKTAILVKDSLQFGFSPMYESYAEADNVPWQVEIFYSAKDAGEWLELDLSEILAEK